MTTPLNPEVFDLFLDHLRLNPSQKAAAEFAGTTISTLRKYRDRMPSFAAEWDGIMADWLVAAEDELHRRAVDGVERPVYQGGVEVGTVREFSDSLLQFLLRAKKPEVYRDKQEVTHKGQVGLTVLTGLPSPVDDLL